MVQTVSITIIKTKGYSGWREFAEFLKDNCKMWTRCTWRSWGSDCEAKSPEDSCPRKYNRSWRRKSDCPNGTTFGAMRKMIEVSLSISKKNAEDLIWNLHELEFIHVTKCWDGDGDDECRVAFWC